jgi:hypothetical protein
MDLFIISVLVLVITGIIIGFASGLLGVGGGFLMVPVQFWLLTSMGVDPTVALRVAFGTSLAVVIPTALSSAWGHHCKKCVLVRPLTLMIIPCIIGAFIGGTIATHLPGPLMELIFGVLVILAAIRMLIAIPDSSTRGIAQSIPLYLGWGFVFGGVSGMLGIGGGIVMVPIMVTLMGFSMYEALGTSTALMLFSSISGAISYIVNGFGTAGLPPYSIGYVNLVQWLPLVVVSIPMAQVGVRTAHRLPADKIRYIFVIVMAIIGVHMVQSGLFR